MKSRYFLNYQGSRFKTWTHATVLVKEGALYFPQDEWHVTVLRWVQRHCMGVHSIGWISLLLGIYYGPIRTLIFKTWCTFFAGSRIKSSRFLTGRPMCHIEPANQNFDFTPAKNSASFDIMYIRKRIHSCGMWKSSVNYSYRLSETLGIGVGLVCYLL